MRGVLLLASLAACGRYDFAARGDAGNTRDGGAGDSRELDSATPVGCAAVAYELCDGFEGTSFDAVWMVDTDVSLDTTFAHRGSQSAHFQMPATTAGTSAEAAIAEATTLPLGDPTTYVRAYIRFGALPAGGNQMELIAATQASDLNEDAVFMSSVDLAVYKQWSPEDSEHDLVAPALDTWLCVQFTIQRSITNNGALLLGGDVTPVSITNAQTDGAPPIVDVIFGAQLAATNQPDDQPQLDVWIDDVIVDKNPVTCAD